MLLSSSAHSRAAAIELADDRPARVALAQPASRIVSLAPFLTELAFSAGAGQRLVGVSAHSDYPSAARAIPSVGDAVNVDLERLLGLKPDLVLAWKSGNHPADIQRISKLGIPVLVVEAQRLPDIPRLLRLIGRAAGTKQEAESAAAAFEHRLEQIQARHQARPPVRVFFEVWHRPLMTVNGAHFVSDAIRRCGGVNVFAHARSLTPTVGMEDVLAADPQAIVGGGSESSEAALRAAWANHTSLRAVRNGHVFHLHPDLIQRQTPRLLDGMQRLCEQLDAVRTSPPPGTPPGR